MMNKKGFTLTELLCVIAILGIVATMATVSIVELSKKSNKNMYCTKIELLESKAYDYGKSHQKELNESTEIYNGYKSITITVDTLVKNGFKADKDGKVINPIDDKSMNDMSVIIYLKNNNIYTVIENNVC